MSDIDRHFEALSCAIAELRRGDGVEFNEWMNLADYWLEKAKEGAVYEKANI